MPPDPIVERIVACSGKSRFVGCPTRAGPCGSDRACAPAGGEEVEWEAGPSPGQEFQREVRTRPQSSPRRKAATEPALPAQARKAAGVCPLWRPTSRQNSPVEPNLPPRQGSTKTRRARVSATYKRRTSSRSRSRSRASRVGPGMLSPSKNTTRFSAKAGHQPQAGIPPACRRLAIIRSE